MVAEACGPLGVGQSREDDCVTEAATVSHVALLIGASGQDVVTPSVLLPPPAGGRVAAISFSAYEHALAGWITATSRLSTVTIAVCVFPLVFAVAFT